MAISGMDAQYPFASREDIWRVQEEVKDLFAAQIEHGERISRLERRRDDDARMKSVWGPLSPFPGSIGTVHHQESSFNPTAEPFKGFDQTHQHGLTGALHLEHEEEPRRGASRANSVRFDESSMYYGQANRSTTELLPLRTGSGLGSHPLTERSLSHRSDGKQSSSGQSHHSARTNSMGLEASRLLGGGTGPSSTSNTPLPPPPGLFILGPVPCIIRCWLTTNFSNDSLLYAAVCTGSYRSAISEQMVRKLGLEGEASVEDGVRIIKLPVYLPEASVYQPSSRGGSPVPQLPALTVRFIIRAPEPNEKSIQIFLGSDVLRAHNADILFSQDKMLIVDDERNKISIPLVRPEDDSTFRNLSIGTEPAPSSAQYNGHVNEKENVRIQMNGDQSTPEGASVPLTGSSITSSEAKPDPSTLTLRTSSDSFDLPNRKPTRSPARHHRNFATDDNVSDHSPDRPPKSSTSDRSFPAPPSASSTTGSAAATAKSEGSGVWGPWRRPDTGTGTVKADSGANSPFMSAYQRSTRTRNMKVLKPSKSSSSASGSMSSVTPAGSRQVSSTTPMPTTTTGIGIGMGSIGDRVSGDDASQGLANGGSAGGKGSSSDGAGAGAGGPWAGKSRAANPNPVGGASAFGWLNSAGRKREGSGE